MDHDAPSSPSAPFGILLQRFRNAKNLTQFELAEKAGLSRNGIADLERGARTYPRPVTIDLLATALGLSASQKQSLQTAARRPLKADPRVVVRPLPAPLEASDSLPFLGRDAELGTLLEALSGPGLTVAAVSGPAGMGKTRLLAELARGALEEGWGVEYGRCHRWSHLEVYSPFSGILDPEDFAKNETVQAFPSLQRFVRGLSQPDQEHWSAGQLDRERQVLFGEFSRYLGSHAGNAGCLVLLDDLQWIGGDAVHLLQSLVHSTPEYKLLLVLSFRSTDIDDSHALSLFLSDCEREQRLVRLPLGPLGPDPARRLLRHVAAEGGKSSAPWDSLVDRALGVPYFLVQFGLQLSRQGAEVVPRAVEECLVQQYDQLAPAAKTIGGLVAVTSLSLSLSHLVEAGGLLGITGVEVSAAVMELTRRGLVREQDGRFVMFHDLVRDVVAGQMGPAARQLGHLTLAGIWQGTLGASRPEVVAWHYREGQDTAKAFPFFSLAGVRAERLFSDSDAEAYYRAALELEVGALADRSLVISRLARVLLRQGRVEEAAPLIHDGLDRLEAMGLFEEQAMLLSDWMSCSLQRGMIKEGLSRALAFVPVARTLAPSFSLAYFLAGLSFLHYAEKDLSAQIEVAEWATSLLPSLREPAARLEVLEAQSIALTSQGRYRESADLVLAQILPFTKAMGDKYKQMVVTLNLAMSLNMLGDYREVAELLDQARPLLAIFTGRRALGFSLFLATNQRYEAGTWSPLPQGVRDFLSASWNAEADFEAEVRLEVGRLKRLLGDADGAAKEFAQALSRPVVVSTYSLLPTILEAEIQLYQGNPELASVQLALLDDDPWKDYPAMHDWVAMRACAQVWAGGGEQGFSRLDEAVEESRKTKILPSLADCLRFRGWALMVRNRLDAARVDLEEALTLDTSMGRSYGMAKDLTLLALLETANTADHWNRALALLGDLSERVLSVRIEAFRASGACGWRAFFGALAG